WREALIVGGWGIGEGNPERVTSYAGIGVGLTVDAPRRGGRCGAIDRGTGLGVGLRDVRGRRTLGSHGVRIRIGIAAIATSVMEVGAGGRGRATAAHGTGTAARTIADVASVDHHLFQ